MTALSEPCGCESWPHFRATEPATAVDADDRDGHPAGHAYLAVPAGDKSAMYVGRVCDDCANTHMAPYLTK